MKSEKNIWGLGIPQREAYNEGNLIMWFGMNMHGGTDEAACEQMFGYCTLGPFYECIREE